MKKILLATTVLVGTAGFAAAEVTLSGNGRMGVTYTEALVPGAEEIAFNSRVRASVNLSSTTDGGLEFGGSFGIHDAVPAAAGTEGSVFISGAFGKLAMGGTDSAAQNAVGQLAGVGYTGIGDHNEIGYLTSGDKETALYSYSASGFTGFLSVGQPDNANDTWSLGAKYATDAFSVALGYEEQDGAAAADDKTQLSAAASATFSGVTAKVIYSKTDTNAFDPETYGVSATYAIDAISVTGFLRVADLTATDTGVYTGIGASYSLGGGATLAGGIANNDGQTKADLGVNFSF
jgi:outer membrane protein OmpU